jgi:hypothetical protein
VWEKKQLEVMQRWEVGSTARIAVDTIYYHSPLDTTSIIARQSSPNFSATFKCRNSGFLGCIEFFDFDVDLTTLEYKAVCFVLDGSDFFQFHTAREFDVARCRSSGKGPRECREVQAGLKQR